MIGIGISSQKKAELWRAAYITETNNEVYVALVQSSFAIVR